MKFQIRSRWTNEVKLEVELDASFESQPYGMQLGAAIKIALKSDCDLRGSNLIGSNLSDSDLSDCDLSGSILSRSNLSRSNLSDCDLSDCDLSGSILSRSNLRGSILRGSNLSRSILSYSNLSDCNLSYSNLSLCDLRLCDLSGSILRDCDLRGSILRDCDLRGSNLIGSNLSDSDLRRCNLRAVKADFFDVLLRASHEVAALETALLEGRVDGSQYEGECACLVGTIANAKHCNYEAVPNLKPNSWRASERWFLAIRPGDTPEKSQIAAITLEWIGEFKELLAAATK